MVAFFARCFQGLSTNLKSGFKGILPLIVLIIYTIVGALLFEVIEGPNEQFELEMQQKERAELLDDTVFRLNNIRRMTPPNAYNHTMKTLLRFQEKLGVSEVSLNETKWNMMGSIFYCMTVYTTIGYGNIVPVTTAGRVLTILYAFIGIPVALISLFCLGSIFARMCRFLWKGIARGTAVVNKDLEKKVNEAVGMHKQTEDDDDLLNFPVSFLIIVTIGWVLLCALAFTFIEDWDYGTSLYFTLISFLTIGFGDVLPSKYDYIILVGVIVLIGLALVSTMMTLVQQQIEALATGVQDNIDKEYANALAEAEDEGDLTASTIEDLKDNPEGGKVDKRSMSAVVSRMPVKERMLYHLMSAKNKKQLEQHAEDKQKMRNRGIQTDKDLLDAMIREEILKMELNNELEHFAHEARRQPTLVSSNVEESYTPISVTHVMQPPSYETTVPTRIVQEDEV